MASLAARRIKCSLIARRALAEASASTSSQTRQYAMSVKAGRQGSGFRRGGDDEGGGDPNAVSAPREKSIGTFKPMGKGGLSNKLFQQDEPDGLVLESFKPEILTDRVIGQAMQFQMNENDPFRIFGLPKNMLLEFRLLSKPCSVIRDVTIKAIDMLDAASVKSSRDTRVILTGENGTGKSFTLLQALQYCVSRDWIVMYIPRAIALVNSSTPHIYDPRTRTYVQPAMAFQLLQRMLTVNREALSDIPMANELAIDRKPTVSAGTSLKDLIDVGLRDQLVAPVVLEALMSELGEQTQKPVMLAIDDVQALFTTTKYRDPNFKSIQSYHLSMPRLLLEYISGNRTFARGAIFGAISTTNTSYPTPLELRESLELPHPIPASPYFKRSSVFQSYASGLTKLSVPDRLSVDEAAGMFGVWRGDRALHSAANDELFLAKYTEASGNPRDFVWRGLLGTLET